MSLPQPSAALFVVACPACGGWAAAGGDLAGSTGCCPRCAASFLVPRPPAETSAAPPLRNPVPVAVAPAAEPPAAGAESPAPTGIEFALPGAEAPASEAAHADLPPPTFEVPDHVLAGVEAAADLQFREPVRTVGHGANVVELRRLSPEEKDARRRRRNVIMLLTGAAVLIAIVFFCGGLGGRRH